MLIIRGTQDIYISKGDTVNIGINLVEWSVGNAKEDYEMADREYIIFKLWDKDFSRVLDTIRTADGTSVVHIDASFTNCKECGGYKYSADLMYADGTKETVIGKTANAAPKFVILEA